MITHEFADEAVLNNATNGNMTTDITAHLSRDFRSRLRSPSSPAPSQSEADGSISIYLNHGATDASNDFTAATQLCVATFGNVAPSSLTERYDQSDVECTASLTVAL